MDRDVKRPVTNGEHDKHDLYNLDERVGHIGFNHCPLKIVQVQIS
jgi:hypothetical protein